MTNVADITKFCNDTLDLKSFPDYGPMGLQFTGSEQVNKIACAVSISKDVITRAHEDNASLLIVHHGMFWNNESRILDDRVGGRLELLEKYGISVLAYHLALDAHPKYGNNILLARNLGLQKLHRWQEIGYSGGLRQPMNYAEFWLKGQVKLGCDHIPFVHASQDNVQNVAVIAGGAAQYIVQAHRDGFDTFVTGEPTEPSMYLAQDLGMNFFAFGHDKTERAGVQSLTRLVSKRFGLPWSFIPVENPV